MNMTFHCLDKLCGLGLDGLKGSCGKAGFYIQPLIQSHIQTKLVLFHFFDMIEALVGIGANIYNQIKIDVNRHNKNKYCDNDADNGKVFNFHKFLNSA